MNKYNLTLSFYYESFMNYKEKDANILINIIGGSRMAQKMNFRTYANVTFDSEDKIHKNAIVNELEKYTRGKVNAFVFNLNHTDENPGIYDRLLIYHTEKYTEGKYGCIFYNTETNTCNHQYMIEPIENSLLFRIDNTLRLCNKKFVYESPMNFNNSNRIVNII